VAGFAPQGGRQDSAGGPASSNHFLFPPERRTLWVKIWRKILAPSVYFSQANVVLD
jgi:hypothetical protein